MEAGDGGSTLDSAVTEGDGGVPAPPCGKPAAHGDDFDDAELHPGWNNSGNGLISDGHLAIDVVSSVDSGVVSRSAVDLRDSSAVLRVLSAPIADSIAFGSLELRHAYGASYHRISLTQTKDTISFGGSGAPGLGGGELSGFAPDEERWWRIREEAGALRFGVSDDPGGEWLSIGEMSAPDWIEAVQIAFVARVGFGDPEGTFVVDDFSIDDTVDWCPMSQIQGIAGMPKNQWFRTTQIAGCSFAGDEEGMTVQLVDLPSWCRMTTRINRRLIDDKAEVIWDMLGEAQPAVIELAIHSLDGSHTASYDHNSALITVEGPNSMESIELEQALAGLSFVRGETSTLRYLDASGWHESPIEMLPETARVSIAVLPDNVGAPDQFVTFREFNGGGS